MVLYKMVMKKLPCVGKIFGQMKRKILSVPSFMSLECQQLKHTHAHTNTQQKTNDCQPQLKTNPEDIMKDLWVNMRQEEELRPYRELPWGDLDPQITEIMKTLRFNQHEIQE